MELEKYSPQEKETWTQTDIVYICLQININCCSNNHATQKLALESDTSGMGRQISQGKGNRTNSNGWRGWGYCNKWITQGEGKNWIMHGI